MAEPVPGYLAVVVGVSETCGHVASAGKIASLLRRTASYRMDGSVALLTGEQATSGSIESAILQREPTDLLFFYFAGHGGRNGTVALSDDNELPQATLLSWLHSAKAQRVVAFMESCHSGRMADLPQLETPGRVTLIVGPKCSYSAYMGTDLFPCGLGASYFLQVALDGFLDTNNDAHELTCGTILQAINYFTKAWKALRPELDIYECSLLGESQVVAVK